MASLMAAPLFLTCDARRPDDAASLQPHALRPALGRAQARTAGAVSLAAQRGPWQDLVQEFRDAEDMPRADREYFRELVEGVWRAREALDASCPRGRTGPALLDPIEHAVLLIGIYELRHREDVPYRVAINEAVGLAKRFGATDGHKYVNAVLDRAARASASPRALTGRWRCPNSTSSSGTSAAAVRSAPMSRWVWAMTPRFWRAARRDASWSPPSIRLVDGVHFPHGSPPASVGHRALAVNLSDLAAMGARPAWALLALTLPQADESWLSEFAAGMAALARAHDVALVGGDTTPGRSASPCRSWVTCRAQPRCCARAASAGDALFVSGTPGDAAAGLALEQGVCSRRRGARDVSARALSLPRRRGWRSASACATTPAPASMCPTACSGDAGKLARASGCGVEIAYRGAAGLGRRCAPRWVRSVRASSR